MPPRFLWALGFIIALSLLMSLRNRRKREASWTGTLCEIRHQRPGIGRDEARPGEDWVTLLYRTDEGKNGKLKLRVAGFRQYLGGIEPGDRLVKRAGDYLPRKAPQAETAEAGAADHA